MTVEQEVEASVCTGCGAAFACGAAAGRPTCWCMNKPIVVLATEAGAGCYCPACLDKRISEQSSPAT